VGDAGVLIDKTNPVEAGRLVAQAWADAEEYGKLQENALKRSVWFTDEALEVALQNLLKDLEAPLSERRVFAPA
jgi:hypothetical protein